MLYNSIYRADDELLGNLHAYGVGASSEPMLHLQCSNAGDVVSGYLDSFERVWRTVALLT